MFFKLKSVTRYQSGSETGAIDVIKHVYVSALAASPSTNNTTAIRSIYSFA